MVRAPGRGRPARRVVAAVPALAKQGGSSRVEQALNTRGALLFYFAPHRPGGALPSHVAISLGDGRTIEARNTKAGVVVFHAGTVTSTTLR